MRKPEYVRRPRMNALPSLPVFFKLEGRMVLLAGDGPAAAWKTELLAASGAVVRLAVHSPCADLKALIGDAPDKFALLRRPWRDDDFESIALAVGAFDDEKEAKRFASAARGRGVPVNVVDKPSLCDFQFGSIVNRAPVVVSISTDGAAPALAQAIRQRIETLLSPAIADWARSAKNLRRRLSLLLPHAGARAAFWRRFAEAALAAPASHIDVIIKNLLTGNNAKHGKVTLVGAGPGDAEYLTLKAVRALQSADVILFDDLVSDEVLDLARREAKRMLVGKRGGRASCRQDDINEIMLRLARQGKHVVRLKSGDPMIFGRAGEEIDMLEAAGVDVEIAPGVTAALAAAARLKTSLTHRDCAQGVKFITGHSRKGSLPDIDWKAAADPNVTLMVYMGARKAPTLARRLIAEGLSANTPAVAAVAVSRPAERFLPTTLGGLMETDLQTTEPVLLGIGAAFWRCTKEAALPAGRMTAARTPRN